MKFWISLSHTATDHVIPLARRAEAMGFEGIFLADHLFVPDTIRSLYPYDPEGAPPFPPTIHHPDVWALISAIAQVTERLRFGIATYILPLHDLFETARGAATAAVLSGGRTHFSVGAGWLREEFDIRGVPWKSRGRRMDEMIEVLRQLWSGNPTEHHGEFYDFPPLHMHPLPPAPLPILIAGSSPPALRRTARLGDGWVGHGNTPDEAEAILDEIARLRAEAGRSELPFECIVPLLTEPDARVYERLARKGMDAAVSWPPTLALGDRDATLEQELDYVERFGVEVVRRYADLS